jgi:hypothetical protein
MRNFGKAINIGCIMTIILILEKLNLLYEKYHSQTLAFTINIGVKI